MTVLATLRLLEWTRRPDRCPPPPDATSRMGGQCICRSAYPGNNSIRKSWPLGGDAERTSTFWRLGPTGASWMPLCLAPSLAWAWTPRWLWGRSLEDGLAAKASTWSCGRPKHWCSSRTFTRARSTCPPGPFVQTTRPASCLFANREVRGRAGSRNYIEGKSKKERHTWSSWRVPRAGWLVGFFWLAGCSVRCADAAGGRAPRTAKDLRDGKVLLRGPVTILTATRRNTLYQAFVDYLTPNVADYTVTELADDYHSILGEWVAEFVMHAYLELGWSRGKTSETVLAVRDKHPNMAQKMGAAWRRIQAWSAAEPPDLHPPIPYMLLRAMVATALAWGWHEMAVTLLLAFYGLLRPSEYLGVRWKDLVLPHFHSVGLVLFVAVPEHKTQRRGPRRSHVRIDTPEVVSYIARCAETREPSMMIWSLSPAIWRRRLQVLVKNLTGLDKIIYPSSMRPGGATHFFQIWDENVQRVMWRGRWQCQRTLEHYIQELMTHQVLRGVPRLAMKRIERLGDLCAASLEEAAGLLT